jgi:hypothetical protein
MAFCESKKYQQESREKRRRSTNLAFDEEVNSIAVLGVEE